MKHGMARTILLAVAAAGLGVGLQAQQVAPKHLTVQDAIELALKKNLNVRVAGAQVDELGGTRERRFSALLPHASGDVLANRQNRNLAAFGLSVPGIPTVVGPFSYYDSRIFASQSLIDRQAYHGWKASVKQQQAARLDYQDIRDLVIRQTAGLYLDSESAAAEVEAAESRVTTSETLEKLAQDEHDHGLATRVDVVRAQVQLARDQQTLLVARDVYQTSLLVLARFVGLSPGTPLEPAEHLRYHEAPIPAVEEAVQTALADRSDYRELLVQRDSLTEQQKASHARYWPTFSISGDYGALGRNFGTMPGIGEIQGTISITLFNTDRNGEQRELQAREQQLNAQIDDLARGIEQDLRKALLDIKSARQQVAVTEQNLELAQTELELAEDRFRNGVTDNIEVVTAQDALANAQDEHIIALANHGDAQMALARALGATEKIYQEYLP